MELFLYGFYISNVMDRKSKLIFYKIYQFYRFPWNNSAATKRLAYFMTAAILGLGNFLTTG
jgi:hypothetical protein